MEKTFSTAALSLPYEFVPGIENSWNAYMVVSRILRELVYRLQDKWSQQWRRPYQQSLGASSPYAFWSQQKFQLSFSFVKQKKFLISYEIRNFLVETAGLEPVTSCVWRSVWTSKPCYWALPTGVPLTLRFHPRSFSFIFCPLEPPCLRAVWDSVRYVLRTGRSPVLVGVLHRQERGAFFTPLTAWIVPLRPRLSKSFLRHLRFKKWGTVDEKMYFTSGD